MYRKCHLEKIKSGSDNPSKKYVPGVLDPGFAYSRKNFINLESDPAADFGSTTGLQHCKKSRTWRRATVGPYTQMCTCLLYID